MIDQRIDYEQYHVQLHQWQEQYVMTSVYQKKYVMTSRFYYNIVYFQTSMKKSSLTYYVMTYKTIPMYYLNKLTL